jgi:hypothetical protein
MPCKGPVRGFEGVKSLISRGGLKQTSYFLNIVYLNSRTLLRCKFERQSHKKDVHW